MVTAADDAIAIRQPGMCSTTFTTNPSSSMNTTSIGNFMPIVCTARHGARTNAHPAGSDSRSSSPRRRAARLVATSTDEATE